VLDTYVVVHVISHIKWGNVSIRGSCVLLHCIADTYLQVNPGVLDGQ